MTFDLPDEPDHCRQARHRHSRWAFAVPLVVALALSACGTAGGSSSALSELEKSRIAEEWRNCMAEGGLTADIQYDDGINIGVEVPDGISDEQVREIEAGCESIIEELDASFSIDPDDQAALIDAGADLQKCMADAGFTVEIDDQGGISTTSDGLDEGFDEEAIHEAEEACYRQVVPELYEKYAE